MIPKKNPNVDVGRNSSLYFAIGLIIMLSITYSMIQFKSYDIKKDSSELVEMQEEFEDDIPIVNHETLPPPPPPAAAPEIIVVVEDIDEVEETVIESTETTQEEQIADYVAVEEVYVEEVEEEIEVPFSVVEHVPVFPGCTGDNNDELKACFEKKILNHVMKTFKYPERAMEMGLRGKVYVLFAVGADGYITNIRTRGPEKVLEDEAVRIIASLPKMTPGMQRGKPVKVPYSLPINFKLIQQ